MQEFMKQNKINLTVLLLLALVSVLAVATYYSSRVITDKTVANHQQRIVSEAAKTVELWLSQHLRIIKATSEAVQQIPIGNNPDTLRFLQTAMKAGNFSDVYIGLKDGTMIDGANWTPPPGYDPRVRPWYKRAVEANQITFTTPYVDMTTNKNVIAIVKPLVVDGAFAGVISSDIVLDTLKQNVMNVKIGDSGFAFIIDHQGTVLIHPDESRLMTTKFQESDPSLESVLTYFSATGSGSYGYQDQGQKKILSYQKLTNTEWYLCTTVLKEEAYNLAKKTALLFAMDVVFKILGVIVALLLLAIGGSVFILLISKRRLDEIVRQHKEILSGMDKDLKGEINRRKEIETRYQTLFNVANNAIMLSKNFCFVECNEKAMAMFGIDHDQISGKSILDLSPKIQQDGQTSQIKFNQIMAELVAEDQTIFEWTFVRKDGTEFPAEVGVKVLRLDSEMVTLYSIWDISRRANAEHELRQAQKLAAMGEMLSAIAHQWRQPLNALSTYIASLRPAYYNDLIDKAYIDKLVKESDSQIQFMSSTINDFRQYFRPSKLKKVFSVGEAIGSAVKIIRPQLKQNAIDFEINELAKNGKFSVFGYKNELVHVLVNVISNAKDAINEKREMGAVKEKRNHHRITLAVHTNAKTVVIQISDTGCGISASLMPKIFTPYFTTKGTATGTGIGLYMAKQIVEKEMQGCIKAENHAAGAQFIIELPLRHSGGAMHV
jgi:PAS domain S-box-containing protein